MASLFIKDPETADLVARVARRKGKSKTMAVKELFRQEEAKLDQAEAPRRRPIAEWLKEYHRANPLPPPTGLKADKVFFDSLNDEDED